MTATVAFVAADLPFGVATNALAHAALGFASLGLPGAEEIRILGVPGVLLSDLRRQARRAGGAVVVDFTSGMTGETWVEQVERMSRTPAAEHRYYALAVSGPVSLVNDLIASARVEVPA